MWSRCSLISAARKAGGSRESVLAMLCEFSAKGDPEDPLRAKTFAVQDEYYKDLPSRIMAMSDAFNHVFDRAETLKVPMRQAAVAVGVERIAEAIMLRGLFP